MEITPSGYIFTVIGWYLVLISTPFAINAQKQFDAMETIISYGTYINKRAGFLGALIGVLCLYLSVSV